MWAEDGDEETRTDMRATENGEEESGVEAGGINKPPKKEEISTTASGGLNKEEPGTTEPTGGKEADHM